MNFVIEQIPLYKLKIEIFDIGRYNSTDLGITNMDSLQLEGFELCPISGKYYVLLKNEREKMSLMVSEPLKLNFEKTLQIEVPEERQGEHLSVIRDMLYIVRGKKIKIYRLNY